MIKGLYDQIQHLFDFAESPTKRVGTGIPEVDKLIRGPAPGEICMVMGRSYSGKSIIGQNIIEYNKTVPSIFFSMEMPAMQALIRLYAMWSDTPSDEVQYGIEDGNAPPEMWDMLTAFKHHEIVDETGITMEGMSYAIEDFEDRHKIRPEFVVVDYLELLGGAKASGEGYLATEAQATMLKNWAREEDMRVFVLHQTNKQERQWMPPTEDSARNAGFTEADFVIGLWRPVKDPTIDHIERLRLKNTIRCNVIKNRPFFHEAHQIDIPIEPSLKIWRPHGRPTDSGTAFNQSESESRDRATPVASETSS